MHQRERGHLPALSQTPTDDAPAFSKSAPNLDKSRTNNLAQQTNDSPTKASSTSHNNMLGKSVDGLNIIRSNKNKNKTNATASVNINGNATATTKLGSDTQLLNGLIEDVQIINGIYDTDDDDDDEGITGCFNFISLSTNNESYSKRKKHSLDSKMEAHVPSPQNALHLTVQKFGSNAYGQDVHVADEKFIDEHEPNKSLNLDDVPYDRVFFRKCQKSLDNIFKRCDDFNEQFTSQKSRNSKSSGDLTMYSHTDNDPGYEHYCFARFGSSKSQFRRECFFVDQNENNDDDDEYNQNGNESCSFDTGTNHEFSQKSTETSFTDSRGANEFSNNESHFREEHSQLINDQTPSASRKSSVTFRNSNDNLPLPCTSTSNEIFYENINHINMNAMLQHSFVSTSTTDSIFLKDKQMTKQAAKRFEIISHPHPHLHTNATNLLDTKSKLSKKDKIDKTKKSTKHRNMFNPKQILNMLNPKSFSKKSSVLSSNSFYTKFDGKTEMNEQLLNEDDANTTQCNSNATNGNDDSKYDSIYRTKNFLLAKQHDNQSV